MKVVTLYISSKCVQLLLDDALDKLLLSTSNAFFFFFFYIGIAIDSHVQCKKTVIMTMIINLVNTNDS